MQFELGPNHDHGTARVVDTLAEKVLTETTLLALEHVRKRFERTIPRTGHCATASTIVEQRINSLLKHPLFVIDDDLRGPEVEKRLRRLFLLMTLR